MHFSTHVLFCSGNINKFAIKISGSRHRRSRIRATTSDISLLQEQSAFVEAKVRSGLLCCDNCRAGSHSSHLVCFHHSVMDAVEQDVMISILDDRLLDYTTTVPFVTVYAVAKYLLLEDSFFRHQIATYALLRQEDTYFNKHFLLLIHDLFLNGRGLCALPLSAVLCPHTKNCNCRARAFPTLYDGTLLLFFWGGREESVIKPCYFLLLCFFVYT